MSDRGSRDTVVRQLPEAIRLRIPRNAIDRVDIPISSISVCNTPRVLIACTLPYCYAKVTRQQWLRYAGCYLPLWYP